ncbi:MULTISPECIES: excinuclease ABC subunit UvrB [Bacteroidota]|uniref:Excinuclease ABC subunit B n=3 Tax=Bacteroidota TaxID=976 RepID=A0A2X2JT91_SPHMU|nr:MULTISPECIES: excinuclease ABC subunit UvrB [Bacteroidota]AZB25114.1 excinuclease ABC subunit UvrB [Chryseobacterium bernardetii]MDN4011440.1 excinuclease ABC subunit UvrB [Chryseobacterium gambrini]QRQ63202.1 excinuclease ABC subunit UvrB [Sphingobacterium multivorum]QWA38207.1 excinuclease ABC subunit UvrB [Chryseobacterium sp. ZHDP1]SPZ95023.1 Excinuclease ABC subunit B [Sphingobacterium multivorum]
MSKGLFILHSKYIPAGDQPDAIARLVSGIESGATHQTLKGITGSGKTFTMANIIHQLKRPTLILAPNKTLTAQLYDEMKQFFPENAVEFFVSYYDYFQPEMYLPGSDRFVEKDSSINEHLERLRLSTTKSLIERRDTIVVASVSSIYGLGAPSDYSALQVRLSLGMTVQIDQLEQGLAHLQYSRTERALKRGNYRIEGDIIKIFPADSEYRAIQIVLSYGIITSLKFIDAASGKELEDITAYSVSPKTLFAPSKIQATAAADQIMTELDERVAQLNNENRLEEADRLYQRITDDVEMLRTAGYCSGMENYASFFSGRDPKLPPVTLLDYLPKDGLLFIDESHVMIPQISAMYKGDQARKDTLIDYGFRLPSSKNNHPLSFEEFEKIKPQTIFVSATPGNYELKVSEDRVVEQVVRPTGLLDPIVEVRPSANDIDDLLGEIKKCVDSGNRVLITTLTKAAAEELSGYIQSEGFRVRYLHSDFKTLERTEILNDLRAGEFDILIGISLLREGLDIPEASLIAILDADRAGFLRSASALIQMIGRVARNVNGKAIMYADKITPAMKAAIDETESRRKRQIAFNEENHVSPVSSSRRPNAEEPREGKNFTHTEAFCKNLEELCERITELERQLVAASDDHDEKLTDEIRLQLDGLYRQFIYI